MEAIATEPLEVQMQRRASARLPENRLQVNAALCGSEVFLLNSLTLVPGLRHGGGGRTPRSFLDFVIDGHSLFEQFRERGFDVIPCLGWGPPEWQQEAAERLLRKREPDLPEQRTSLFVCPECGDLDCGTISVSISRDGETIVWEEFGLENTYEAGVRRNRLEDVGPFRFDARAYFEILRPVLASRGVLD